jgi:hypothetical protein
MPPPEARFITLCTREPDAVRPGAIRAAAQAVTDGDAAVEMAARHKVAAFLLRAVASEGIDLPAGAQDALRRVTAAAAGHVMAVDAMLMRLLPALHGAGVPALILKGPGLARSVYPISTLRPYDDIDLVVHDRQEAAAAAVLAASGFREVPFGAEEARRARAVHVHGEAAFHRVFASDDGRVLVELHVDVLQLGLKPVCEAGRWRRAVAVPGLPDALMLGPEDQVVQLGAHAHKHGFSRLIWLKDLDLLLRAYGGTLDRRLVGAVARQEGVAASVWYSLHLARALFRTSVAGDVLAELRPAPPVRALYGIVWPHARIAALEGRMRRRAVQVHTADSLRGTLPGLLFMGRRRARVRAAVRSILPR